MLKQTGFIAAGFALTVLAVLAGHYLYGFVTGTRFADTQWAAAGAWLGGIATFAAVVVALWQAKGARETAEESKREARALLSRQLDQELRNAQLRAVQEYVDSVEHLVIATQKLMFFALNPLGLFLILKANPLEDITHGLRRANASARVARTYVRGTPLEDPFNRFRKSVDAFIDSAYPSSSPSGLLKHRWLIRRGGPNDARERDLKRELRQRSSDLLGATYLHSRQGTIHDVSEND